MKKFATITCVFFSVQLFSQNVGIGTVTPAEKLHVFNSGVATVLAETNAANQYAGFDAKTTGGINDKLLLRKYMPGAGGSIAGVNLDNLSLAVTGAQAGPLMVGVITANPLYFTTSNTERMRVTAGGDIGMGTGIPEYSLHIARAAGEASVGVNATGTATQALLNLSIDNRIDGNSLLLMKFRAGVAGTIAGINKSNLSILAADAGAGPLLISTNQASPIYIATNNVERIQVKANGQVNINKAPDMALLTQRSDPAWPISAYFYDTIPTGKRAGISSIIYTNTNNSAAIQGFTTEGGGAIPGIEGDTYGLLGESGNSGIAVGGYSFTSTAIRGKSNSGKALYTSGLVTMDGIGEGAGKVLTSDATGNATWQTLPASASVWAVAGSNIYNTNTGLVGINTFAPTARLHIRNPNADTVALLITHPSGRITRINGSRELYHEGDIWLHSAYGKLRLGYSDKGWYWGTINGGQDLQLWSHSTTDIDVSRVNRMYIDGTTGNVGINTNNNPAVYGKLIVDRNADLNAALGGYFGVVTGLNSSTTDGSGVYGISYATRTGTQSYAGVTGLNLSSATDRFGVIGTSYGTSSGSIYSAGVGGYGDYGVLGYSSSNSGAGMIAQHSNGKTALEINNGFMKVSGANKTAFVHVATVGNLVSGFNYATLLNYPNQAQTDIILVTHVYNPAGGNAQYLNSPISTWWTQNGWAIFNENFGDMVVNGIGKAFNVLVIKQ